MVATKIIVSSETEERPQVSLEAAKLQQFSVWSLISRPWFKKTLLIFTDLICVSLAHWTAEFVVGHWLKIPVFDLNPSGYYLFYIPFFALMLYFFEAYKAPDLRRPEKELELIFKSASLCFVGLTCANFVFLKPMGFSRYLLATWYGITLILLLVTRFSLRAVYGSLWKRGLARQRAILAGPSERLAALQNDIAVQRYRGFDLLGVLTEPGFSAATDYDHLDLPLLGTMEDWEDVTARYDIHFMLIGLPSALPYPEVMSLIRRSQERGIQVEVYSDLFGSSEFKYERDEFSGFFRFYAPSRWSHTVQKFLKAFLDFMVGIVGSIVTLFLIPVVAVLLKLEDGGPIFYRREFVGCDGKVRYYRKFRSMVTNADQLLQNDPELREQFDHKHKLQQDPRVLRVGRFLRKYSIDEFPQFFSLLQGQLTFVGPRVISQAETIRYGKSLQKLLSFKPGMTGYWQVMGRQTTSYDERVQMDMFYIEHWSIWLDLIIVAKTFWRVLRADGAY